MHQKLSGIRHLLLQKAAYDNNIAQLQQTIDENTEQINKTSVHCKNMKAHAVFTFRDNGIRRGLYFGVIGTLTTLFFFVFLFTTIAEGPLTADDIAPLIFIGILTLSPLFVFILLWTFSWRSRKKCSKEMEKDLVFLEELQSNKSRCKSELEDLFEQRNAFLTINRDALAILPETCHSIEALDFIEALFAEGVTEKISAAAKIWKLTAENRKQRELLGKLQEEIISLKAQLPANSSRSRGIDGGEIGFMVAESIFDSII